MFPQIPKTDPLIFQRLPLPLFTDLPRRDCLKSPDSSELKSYELSKRGTEAPVALSGINKMYALGPSQLVFRQSLELDFGHLRAKG